MDVVVLGMLKKYIQETLVGMGALKGAPCQVKDIVNADGSHTITLKWVDDESVSHESSFTVKDGKDGTDGIDGTDGVSPSIVVKTSTDDTYILTITTASDSFDTPNLKGGGSGGSSTLAGLSDVNLENLANEQIIYYDSTTEKFINITAGAIAESEYSAIQTILS